MQQNLSIKIFSLVALAAIVLFFSCAGTNHWGDRIDWAEFSLDSLPGQQDYPDEGAVILLDEGEIEIYNKDGFAFSLLRRHRIVKIFNERGYSFANVTIPYSGATVISDIKARTILPDGRIVPLQKDRIFDVTMHPGFIFYSDVRAKRFTLPAIENGCVVEYRWQKQIKNFSFWDQWPFQHEVPTKISRYRVVAPSEWEINWKTFAIDIEPKTTKVPAGFKQTYVWEARDIPPLIPEYGMPPAKRVAASIIFSPVHMNRWDDIAAWYWGLVKDRFATSDEIENVTAAITGNCTTDKEKLRKIFEFVRDKIRYVAISIGIGGYQPHFATEVLANRYGDCKDKVILIMAMASAIGLDVEPVIISTFQNGKVDTSVASYIHFNHLIAHATLPDSSEIWMDATDRNSSFNRLPWYDQDRLVFIVDRQGKGRWQRTPAQPASANKIERKWTLSAASSDQWRVNFEMTFSGANALLLRRKLAPLRQGDIRSFFCQDFLVQFPDMEIEQFRIKELYRPELPLRVSGSFLCPMNGTGSNAWIMSVNTFSQYDWNMVFTEDERRYPIEIGYPQQVADSIIISIPSNMSASLNLADEHIKNKFGQYDLRSTAGRKIRISRKLCFGRRDIAVEEYKEFKAFLNAIALADQSSFVLFEKKTR